MGGVRGGVVRWLPWGPAGAAEARGGPGLYLAMEVREVSQGERREGGWEELR